MSRPVQEVPCVFPLRRRLMPRRGWHNEEWSRQWLQLLMGPRPPAVQWPRSRPLQPKGSGKGRGRSQPPQREVPVPKRVVSTTRSSPAESESEAAAKLAKFEVVYASLDAESPEGKYLKNVIDKTRVRASHGHPRKRLDECQQYTVRAAKRLEMPSKQWSPQLRSRIDCKKSTTSGPQDWRSSRRRHQRPRTRWTWTAVPTESNNSKPWSQSSAEKGTICDRTAQRRSERARLWQTPHFCFQKRWKSCLSGSRPHLRGCRWPWGGAGGRVVSPVGSRRDEVGQREEEVQPWVSDRPFEVTWQSRYGLRGVRVGEALIPGPRSTRIDSDEEPILPGRLSPWCHGDSAESVPIPGTPPGAANDSTVADTDLESGREEQDGFVSLVSQTRSRRGGGHTATSTTVFPFRPIDLLSLTRSESGTITGRRMRSQNPTLSVLVRGIRRLHVRGEGSCSCHPHSGDELPAYSAGDAGETS